MAGRPQLLATLLMAETESFIGLEEWKRTVHLMTDRQLYIAEPSLDHPAMVKALVSGFPGLRVLEEGGHYYFPLEWIVMQYPTSRPSCAIVWQLAQDELERRGRSLALQPLPSITIN